MKFKKQYSGCKPMGLPENGERIVDTLGYIPRAQKIKNYMQAGLNLIASRIEQYDGDNTVKDEVFLPNPYRDIGMDFSDYERNKSKLQKLVEKKKDEFDKAKKRELERIKKMQDEELKKTAEKQFEVKSERAQDVKNDP